MRDLKKVDFSFQGKSDKKMKWNIDSMQTENDHVVIGR